MSEWISVEERLPAINQPVALLNAGIYLNTGSDDFDCHWYGAGWLSEFGHKYWSVIGESRAMTMERVTHWMPLPEPPKEPSHD